MEQAENAQQAKKYQNRDLIGGVEKLYLQSKAADVHFKFGSEDDPNSIVRVPAHKSLLATASTVFDSMFYGDLKENGDIQIQRHFFYQ